MLVETLESRQLLSATVTTTNDFLNIVGSDFAENISAWYDPMRRQFAIHEYEAHTGRRINRLINAAGIRQVTFLGRGGNDRFWSSIDLPTVAFGDDGNDALEVGGTRAPAQLLGGRGLDTLTGALGNDRLDGGPDNDILDGRTGADTLFGGDGFDTVSYAARTEPLILQANALANSGAPGERDTIMTDVEQLHGGIGNDLIYGSAGIDALAGGPGRDTLFGFGGDDALNGGDGDDYLIGGAGRDFLMGGNGNDTLDARDGGFTDWVVGKDWNTNSDFDRALIDRTGLGSDRITSIDALW